MADFWFCYYLHVQQKQDEESKEECETEESSGEEDEKDAENEKELRGYDKQKEEEEKEEEDEEEEAETEEEEEEEDEVEEDNKFTPEPHFVASAPQAETQVLLKPPRVEPLRLSPPPPPADPNATGNPTVVEDALQGVLRNDSELREVNLNNIDDISQVEIS